MNGPSLPSLPPDTQNTDEPMVEAHLPPHPEWHTKRTLNVNVVHCVWCGPLIAHSCLKTMGSTITETID
eukprot:m.1194615 g.1194615  ORF g.1194615 m.1194615 type:complete len:69 (-) comp24562_c1_seq21:168-374(-)